MTARSIASFLFVLFSTLLAVPGAEAKGWRGLVPLHATRADVERLLGPPTEQRTEYSVVYRTGNETLFINYARGLPCGIGEKYSQWRVPRGTVQSIIITPNSGSLLSQLTIDKAKYRKRSGGDRPDDVYYINDEEGESLRVFQDEVMEITYSPGTSDDHLRCAAATGSSHIDCKGLDPPMFDSYGSLSPAQEKERLDNFVIGLMNQQGRTGYILGYGGKRAHLREAIERAQRARNYLIKFRNFPPSRLKAIDGGYRGSSSVELYVVPPGSCPPTGTPTIDPRDVHIINKGAGHKTNRRSSS